MVMHRLVLAIPVIMLTLSVQAAFGGEKKFTIVHSNDLHSHFLGASPNIDYTPDTTGDDQTLGGWARIATLIKAVKNNRSNPVLVLDAGDFLMGSLFHLLSREEAFELRLMKAMGYDMVALGNHEFDLKPVGLARILATAEANRQIPPLVCANVVFSDSDPRDDTLKKLFDRGVVKPYRILDKGGLRLGIFGLMGKDAAEVAPFASPVSFDDPVEVAKKVVRTLRETEKVDMVICLSHSGLWADSRKSEDEILARAVAGIDVIISGHTHTRTNAAIQTNDTLIVQAGEYGRQVGVLDVIWHDGTIALDRYEIVDIDDSIVGDADIHRLIDTFEHHITDRALGGSGLEFRQIIAETPFDLIIDTRETNLGNLISDAVRWYINTHDTHPGDPASRVSVSIVSNGVIRDPIMRGASGKISVCDAFRALPLGVGFDDQASLGYPLISFYIYPAELKKGFEILTSIYPLKGSDYFLQFSGAKITYNPNRMLFDRITAIALGDEQEGYTPLDYSKANTDLIRVAADIYNATFLKVVGDFTWHILDIIPKDRMGNPISDLKTVRIDADKDLSGIQELKEYMALLEYIQSFADTDRNGVADIPEKYRGPLGRNNVEAGWNPYLLVKGGTYPTWIAVGSVLALIVSTLTVGWRIKRRFR